MYLIKLREDHHLNHSAHARVEIHGARGRAWSELSKSQVDLALLLVDGIEESSAANLDKEAQMFLKTLADLGLLVKLRPTATRNQLWYAHNNLSARAQALPQAHVMILGCGGTGAIIADHLARAGVGSLSLIDGATVDEPDLNRQLPFLRSHVGQPKVNALAGQLEENFNTKCLTHQLYFSDEAQIQHFQKSNPKVDMLFVCADSPAIKINILGAKLAEALDCPVVFGSVGIEDYLVGPLLADSDSRKMYIAQKENSLKKLGPSRPAKASFCLSNTAAAVDQAWLGLRHMLSDAAQKRQMENRLTVVNFFTQSRSIHEMA